MSVTTHGPSVVELKRGRNFPRANPISEWKGKVRGHLRATWDSTIEASFELNHKETNS